MLRSALVTMLASFGTPVALVPDQMGSKPVSAQFSSLGGVYKLDLSDSKEETTAH